MADSKSRTVETDRRGGDRMPFTAKVTLRFTEGSVPASGQNISPEGALFLLDGEVPVRIQVEGESTERKGVLVRLTPHGGGRMGLAVRFVQDA